MRADKPAIFLVGRWGDPALRIPPRLGGAVVAEETAWGSGTSRTSSKSAYLRRLPRLDQTPRMGLPHLFRVILPVSDIEAAASFYARLLAMPGIRVSSGRHYFDCGGTILACYDAFAEGDPGPVGPNPQHVYFSVDDLDAAHTRAEQAGCRELTGIEVRPWGERSFYARDRFENPICFVDSQTLFTGEHAWADTPRTT